MKQTYILQTLFMNPYSRQISMKKKMVYKRMRKIKKKWYTKESIK